MAGAGIGRFAGRLSKLVTAAGGKLEHGRYVARPGVALLAATSLAGDSDMLDSVLRAANVDTSRPDYEQMAELGGRLTYLAFPKEAGSGEDYNRRMAREHGHLSPFGVTSATFLVAGVSVETSLELVAHGEARIARLTSSRTRAMDETLYRLTGSDVERAQQRDFIERFLELRAAFAADASPPLPNPDGGLDAREIWNRLNVGAKATALTFTMGLKDYHRLFIGRMGYAGNEAEVREVVALMCAQLHERFPLVIRAPEEYQDSHNSEKDNV